MVEVCATAFCTAICAIVIFLPRTASPWLDHRRRCANDVSRQLSRRVNAGDEVVHPGDGLIVWQKIG